TKAEIEWAPVHAEYREEVMQKTLALGVERVEFSPADNEAYLETA
ncbi:unnamed protein product, partial [marine sediment metagenome]